MSKASVADGSRDRLQRSALSALALHLGNAATERLAAFARDTQLARTHRFPEIRRQAMFWLGQSEDPRAIDFFEQVLKLK